AAIDHRAMVEARADHAVHTARLDNLEVSAVPVRAARFHIGAHRRHMARACSDLHPPVLQIALNTMARDVLFDDVMAAIADVAKKTPPSIAKLGLEAVLPADAGDHLPAVAPRGAPADALRLENDDTI